MNVTRQPGIYIHIPFCKAKCGYCDFYSIEDSSLSSAFLDALIQEIKLFTADLSAMPKFDTIYLGGGTPSLLPIENLSQILSALPKYCKLDPDCEITIEVNPGTINLTQLKKYRELGINRISLGIQSFIDKDLQVLGRIHTVANAVKTIEDSKTGGFNNINLDLIFALPHHTLNNWEYTIRKALSFDPEHLSIYNLTFEPGTPFYQKLRQGRFVKYNDVTEGKYYNTAHSILAEAGYLHYEVSNYAKSEELVSRHNYKYWSHTPYVGFGPSAHSFWDNYRWSNVASVRGYINQLQRDTLPRSMTEKLKNSQLIFENIFLALRTYQGLNLNSFKNRFGMEFIRTYRTEVDKLINLKLAEIQNDCFRLTEKGMLVCDEILPAFAAD